MSDLLFSTLKLLLGIVFFGLLIFAIALFFAWWRSTAGCNFPAETLLADIPARCAAFYR